MKMLSAVIATIVAGIVLTLALVYGSTAGWFRAPIAEPGDPAAFKAAAVRLIEDAGPGNIAVALVEDGELVESYFSSKGQPVDGDTLFQVASLSKWVTAWGVMTLIEDGKVELDAPVSRYLTRWQLPPGEYDNDGVTVRRLLSHTAGLTDGLGFAGHPPDDPLPTLEEALNNPRASGGRQVQIAAGLEPGSEWAYSGGGYLVLQLLIEEVSGRSFEDYMQRAVFHPLGMSRSTFVSPDESDTAESFSIDGQVTPLYRFRASSAAGLYTTTNDMTRFLLAQLAPPEHDVLSAESIKGMRTPHGYRFGMAIWGLGPILYAPTGNDDFVFGHDGLNEPAINTAARLNPESRDGLVVFTTGSQQLATTVGYEWTIWQTGIPGTLGFTREIPGILKMIFGLWLGLALILSIVVYRQRKARQA